MSPSDQIRRRELKENEPTPQVFVPIAHQVSAPLTNQTNTIYATSAMTAASIRQRSI